MQALSLSEQTTAYTAGVQTGRPSIKKRPPFGARLHALREQAGLSQQQLAERMGMTQRAYAYWERNPVALRPDQLQKLAEALSASVEELISENAATKRGKGPSGRARLIFEEVSKLPRSRQQRILATVEDMLTAQRVAASS
jgi:transcriptional regulator with XRE-family HTH domain